MPAPPARKKPQPDQQIDRAQAFVSTILQTYERYHNHKEAMAYTGFTLYAALFGAAILAPKWPHWSESFTIVAASTSWLFFLLYLGWQLRLRRLASIRVAGLERLLANWIRTSPSRTDLELVSIPPSKPSFRHRLLRFASIFWPIRSILPKSDLPDTVYPTALVTAWNKQLEERGTDAMFHERLLFLAGWLLYVLVLARAIGFWKVAA